MASSPSIPRRRWPLFILGGMLLIAALAGGSMGYFLRFDLPDVRALEDYTPPVMSRVLDSRGEVVATFAEQRRMLIRYGDIPEEFLQALIATEDAHFHSHTGIDFKGILRAAWSDLRSLRMAQGASTLTQQLARNLFLHPDKTIRRKVQEVLLALEIERQYTKQEILGFYCNQVYTGHGRYGLEAAARHYFGKPAAELTRVESATIAGLIQRPEGLSPLKHPQRAVNRRNHVLGRMAEEGMLTREEHREALATPLEVGPRDVGENFAPYFVEDVRRWLQEKYGSSSLYQDGFEVHTTLDLALQRIANEAVELGLREHDKRQGFRPIEERVPEGEDPEIWHSPAWERDIEPGDVTEGVVVAVDDGSAHVRIDAWSGTLGSGEIAWTGFDEPSEFLTVGDRIQVRLLDLPDEGDVPLELEQAPLAEGALVAIEPSTGAVRALVGGLDFERSEFNRAVQAKRQTGSAFKPFVFAAALLRGHTLADTLLDEPTVWLNRRTGEPYQPENYTRRYYETLTLRAAMEKSANVATVKLLEQIGYEPVIEMARSMGIDSQLRPFPSMALGAFELSLMELTSAYGTFANGGVHVQPHLVREIYNRDAARVTTIEPKVRDAVSPQIAYLMNRVLAGVITDGTGRRAANLQLNLAGKTGTTDNNTDAWFVGYEPRLAVGVWVGYDDPQSLGHEETGAVAALPIWRRFLDRALAEETSPEFERPSETRIVSIDRRTGLKASHEAGCTPVFSEVFVRGTEPTEYCTENHHRLLRFPYPFQRYPLTERGMLRIPEAELNEILEAELSVFLADGGTRLEVHGLERVVSLPLEVVPGSDVRPVPAWIAERYDTSEWIGTDGRDAYWVWSR
ncbi:MAG: PBP1A family penicillin-binding protein [bacterium]|nr:PBP1A family penicillin-binding protein [bacterium]